MQQPQTFRQWFLTSRYKKCFAIPPVADDGRRTFGQGLDTREEERSRPRHGNLTWSLWLFCMHGSNTFLCVSCSLLGEAL